jgi:GNAT superfamily N-acetyltransferase
MNPVIIRKAVKEDCKRLMELIYQLAVYEKAPDEVTVTLEHFEESGFGEKPVWWAFVAVTDNVVQGFGIYFIRYRTWKGQYMFLEDFIVAEEFRGRGIGKLLFDKFIEEAKERKFKGMVWQVFDWNEPAINFYKKYDGVTFNKEWIDCFLPFES